MSELLWKIVAKVVSWKPIANAIIAHAKKHPYVHISNTDGTPYMNRYWLFNPISQDEGRARRWKWCDYSVRVHWIRSADQGEYMHDHPWSARTIILSGFYWESRKSFAFRKVRKPGDTATIEIGEYHKIFSIAMFSETWTIFITKGNPQPWGFLVDGKKVPWRDMGDKR